MAKEKCKAKRKDGSQCNAYRINNSQYCFFHDPKMEAIRHTVYSDAGKSRQLKYNVPYLLAMNGHLFDMKSKDGKCILCGETEGRYCHHGLRGDKLYEFMDNHPYLYMMAEFNNFALNEGFWWFGVRDTREGDDNTFNISFYSDEPVVVTLPEIEEEHNPLESLSARQLDKLLRETMRST